LVQLVLKVQLVLPDHLVQMAMLVLMAQQAQLEQLVPPALDLLQFL
jgi:hypothetical protein